jgi:hypothetical protein
MRSGFVTASLFSIALAAPLSAHAQTPSPANPASTNPDWVETQATCARLQALVTTADIEKVTGRKGTVISAAAPDRTDGCTLSIRLPKEKTDNGAAGIGISLRQYISPAKASQNIKGILELAGSAKDVAKAPPRDVARDARGRLFQFKYIFDYAVASIDATELTLLVRDKTLKGADVVAALGPLLFQRALASADIATYATHSNELLTHVIVRPMQFLIERCSKPDAPAHEETRKAFAASAFATLTVAPASTFSDYTQRWLKQQQADEQFARQVATIGGPMTPALADDCTRTPQEIPAMERAMQPLFKHMRSK